MLLLGEEDEPDDEGVEDGNTAVTSSWSNYKNIKDKMREDAAAKKAKAKAEAALAEQIFQYKQTIKAKTPPDTNTALKASLDSMKTEINEAVIEHCKYMCDVMQTALVHGMKMYIPHRAAPHKTLHLAVAAVSSKMDELADRSLESATRASSRMIRRICSASCIQSFQCVLQASHHTYPSRQDATHHRCHSFTKMHSH